jgi:hypothetical protein
MSPQQEEAFKYLNDQMAKCQANLVAAERGVSAEELREARERVRVVKARLDYLAKYGHVSSAWLLPLGEKQR